MAHTPINQNRMLAGPRVQEASSYASGSAGSEHFGEGLSEGRKQVQGIEGVLAKEYSITEEGIWGAYL